MATRRAAPGRTGWNDHTRVPAYAGAGELPANVLVPEHDLVEGVNEARGRAVPAREWFDVLQAPGKVWTELPQSGHRPAFEQPERFAEVMRTILAETR